MPGEEKWQSEVDGLGEGKERNAGDQCGRCGSKPGFEGLGM